MTGAPATVSQGGIALESRPPALPPRPGAVRTAGLWLVVFGAFDLARAAAFLLKLSTVTTTPRTQAVVAGWTGVVLGSLAVASGIGVLRLQDGWRAAGVAIGAGWIAAGLLAFRQTGFWALLAVVAGFTVVVSLHRYREVFQGRGRIGMATVILLIVVLEALWILTAFVYPGALMT